MYCPRHQRLPRYLPALTHATQRPGTISRPCSSWPTHPPVCPQARPLQATHLVDFRHSTSACTARVPLVQRPAPAVLTPKSQVPPQEQHLQLWLSSSAQVRQGLCRSSADSAADSFQPRKVLQPPKQLPAALPHRHQAELRSLQPPARPYLHTDCTAADLFICIIITGRSTIICVSALQATFICSPPAASLSRLRFPPCLGRPAYPSLRTHWYPARRHLRLL